MFFRQAQKGDTLSISAREWNFAREGANIAEAIARRAGGQGLRDFVLPGQVMAAAKGQDLLAGDLVVLEEFFVAPESLGTSAAHFCVAASLPEEGGSGIFAVMEEDAKQGSYGKANCCGLFLVPWSGKEEQETKSFAEPDGKGGVQPADGGITVVAADASASVALIALGGEGTAISSCGMFDTRLVTENDSTILECWNSSQDDDCKVAGILSVNGQHYEVQRGKQTLPKGKTVYCWAVFRAPVRAEESSTLNGKTVIQDVPEAAYLECTTVLMDSSPELTYSLIATVHPDGVLDKARPRGVIEAVWFGPARDLWKDTIATGTTK